MPGMRCDAMHDGGVIDRARRGLSREIQREGMRGRGARQIHLPPHVSCAVKSVQSAARQRASGRDATCGGRGTIGQWAATWRASNLKLTTYDSVAREFHALALMHCWCCTVPFDPAEKLPLPSYACPMRAARAVNRSGRHTWRPTSDGLPARCRAAFVVGFIDGIFILPVVVHSSHFSYHTLRLRNVHALALSFCARVSTNTTVLLRAMYSTIISHPTILMRQITNNASCCTVPECLPPGDS
eukprot:IDg13150t1